MYKSEDLAGMSQDQLKAAILELQARMAPAVENPVAAEPAADTENVDTAADNAQQPVAPVVAEPTPFEKLSAKIDDLEADGSGLYDAAIEVMKQQRKELIAEAHAVAIKAEEDVKKVTDEVETDAKAVEQEAKDTAASFIDKYGEKIIEGTKIVLLGVIAGKILGWL